MIGAVGSDVAGIDGIVADIGFGAAPIAKCAVRCDMAVRNAEVEKALIGGIVPKERGGAGGQVPTAAACAADIPAIVISSIREGDALVGAKDVRHPSAEIAADEKRAEHAFILLQIGGVADHFVRKRLLNFADRQFGAVPERKGQR